MSKKEVFISYKAEEFDDAKYVKDVLEDHGISCWMAPMCIQGGSSYAMEIPQAIRDCKAFVLILSEKCQTSKWVPRELDQAINDEKTILPFMLENCPLKDDFSFYLTNVQRYAAWEDRDAALEKMIGELYLILGKTPVIEKAEVKEEVEVKAPAAPKAAAVKKARKKAPEKKAKKSKKRMLIPIVAVPLAFFIALSVLIGVLIAGNFSKISIAGHEFKKNDRSIDIDSAELTNEDIENLYLFKELYSINITNSTLPYENMGKLVEAAQYTVVLKNCKLTDKHLSSTDFSKCTLLSLDISDNPEISDISSLAIFGDKLDVLNISNTGVSDISVVSSFIGLEELYASGNTIENISAVSDLAYLVILDLSENCIKSEGLSGLAECTSLVNLNIAGNGLDSIDGLEKCIYLDTVDVSQNNLKSVKGLENSTKLVNLKMGNAGSATFDIGFLSKSKETLKELDLSGCKLEGFEALSDCIHLEVLSLDNTGISGEDLKALSKHTNIEYFSANYCNIDSIEALKNCKKLNHIDVSHNKLLSTKGFDPGESDNIKYPYANFSYNQITELILPEGKDYTHLDISGNKIENFDVLYKNDGSVLILDYNDGIDFYQIAEREYYNVYVLECPLDKKTTLEDILGSTVIISTAEEVAEKYYKQ